MMKNYLTEMLSMQDAINTQVNDDWRSQNFEWYRAVWIECAELLDHYGWKWWKKQVPDMEQVSLELVDIWHFGLSMILETSDSVSSAAETVLHHIESSEASSESDFKLLLEQFVAHVLARKEFHFGMFLRLTSLAGLSFDDLYLQYVAKNVLNRFRQDHGYKQGTYVKVWDGREDNEHLFDILKQAQTADGGLPPSFAEFLYGELSRRYN